MLLQQCVQTLQCFYQMLGCSLLPSFASVSVSMQRVTNYNSFASIAVTKDCFKGHGLFCHGGGICYLRHSVSDIVVYAAPQLKGALKPAVWQVHCGDLWFSSVGDLLVAEEMVVISLPKHLQDV